MNIHPIAKSPQFMRIAHTCILLILVALAPAVQSEQSWISILGGTPSRISDDTADQTLPILVKLEDGVEGKNVSLAKLYVTRDNVPLPAAYADGFDIETTLTPLAGSYIARIKIAADKVKQPGSYDIYVGAQVSQPAGKPAQTLKVTVEHPAAAITVLEPVKIHIVQPIGWEAASIAVMPLKLELKSDVPRLDHPILGPVIFPEAKSPVLGQIKLKDDIKAFGKGAALQADLTAEGDFPLGVLDGIARLSGDQLKESVSVKVTVKTVRSLIWLYAAAAAGLLFGLILKIWLERYLALRRARTEGLRMLAEAERQRILHPDESLTAALKAETNKLNEVVKGSDAGEIGAAAAALKAILPQALDELLKNQQAIKTKIDEWLQAVAVTPARNLPDDLAAAVAAGTENLQAAADMVSKSIAQAEKEHAETIRKLREGLQDAVGTWRRRVAERLDALQDSTKLPLPRAVGEKLSAEATVLHQNLDAIANLDSIDAASFNPAFANSLLDQVDGLRRAAQAYLLKFTSEELGRVVMMLLKQLSQIPGAEPSKLASIESALAAAQKKLAEGEVEQRIEALRPDSAEEIRALDDLIRILFTTLKVPTADNQAAIDKLAEQRDYLGAAEQLRKAFSARADTLLGEAAAAGGAPQQPQTSYPRTTLIFPVTRSVELSPLAAFPSVEDVELSLARTTKEILFAEAVQTAAIGILLGLVAYGTYAEQFVGTSKEIIGIFFWAFSLDLTVAKLLDAGKVLK